MTQYSGLLGHLQEAIDIQRELDCSHEEAWRIQRERNQERRAELERQDAIAEVMASVNPATATAH